MVFWQLSSMVSLTPPSWMAPFLACTRTVSNWDDVCLIATFVRAACGCAVATSVQLLASRACSPTLNQFNQFFSSKPIAIQRDAQLPTLFAVMSARTHAHICMHANAYARKRTRTSACCMHTHEYTCTHHTHISMLHSHICTRTSAA